MQRSLALKPSYLENWKQPRVGCISPPKLNKPKWPFDSPNGGHWNALFHRSLIGPQRGHFEEVDDFCSLANLPCESQQWHYNAWWISDCRLTYKRSYKCPDTCCLAIRSPYHPWSLQTFLRVPGRKLPGRRMSKPQIQNYVILCSSDDQFLLQRETQSKLSQCANLTLSLSIYIYISIYICVRIYAYLHT